MTEEIPSTNEIPALEPGANPPAVCVQQAPSAFAEEKATSGDGQTRSGHARSHPGLMTLLTVLIPAVLGIAASAMILSSWPASVCSAMAKNAAGYGDVFTKGYTAKDAFLSATALCRADIAVFFISMLFPYTAISRPLTAAVSFLRALLMTMAITVSSSPLGIISLSAGAVSLFFVLRRADSLYTKMRSDDRARPKFRDCAESILLSVVCSGGLIAARTALLLLGGLSAVK